MKLSALPGGMFLLVFACCLPSFIQGVPLRDMSGLVGDTVLLPCTVDTAKCGHMHSIKWYRGTSRIFVFSEMSSIANAEGIYTDRAEMHYTANSTESTLKVKKLQVADEAVYKCEITYIEVREGCSVVQFINLTALIKPEYVKVTRGDGGELANSTLIGPFNEGDELTLECESGGGKPIPSVYWWNGTHKLEGNYQAVSGANSVGTGRNRIRVTLGRGDLYARYECRAKNAALQSPMVSWVNISVHLRPLSLTLRRVKSYVVQDNIVTIKCSVNNALPAANITWYNGTTPYHEMEFDPETRIITGLNMEADGTFTTLSELSFTASIYDDSKTISCAGINAVMAAKGEKPLRESQMLIVHYRPIVNISSVSSDNVTVNESTDISLFCTYNANPMKLKSIEWYRDGQLLVVNTDHYEEGTPENPMLLIKNATRHDQGAYTCVLTNSVDAGQSTNAVYVSVYYKPQVKLLMEPPSPVSEVDALNITLTCKVESGNPETLRAVRWYLGGEILKELPDCDNASNAADPTFCDIDPSKLLLEYVVRGFHGNYSCEGMNEAGWGPLSAEEELVVYYPPGPATLVYEPSRVIKKGSVTLSCSVDDPGRPETTQFYWMRGSHHIPDVTTADYLIDPVTLETQSNFTCLAYNAGGKGYPASVYINVLAKPTFLNRLPQYSGALLTSKNISLHCLVECSPLCSIQWLKNEKVLETGEGSRYSVINTPLPPDFLRSDFQSVRSELVWNMSAWEGGQLDRTNDKANYTCQSTDNGVGPRVQSTTYFGVEYPPENITLSTKILNVTEHKIPGEVRCEAKAVPDAFIQWQRVSQPNYTSNGSVLHLNTPISRQESGNYTCIARNKHGRISENITINVQYKPECGIKQQFEQDGKLVLTCTADANPPEVDFVWHIKGENETIEENVVKKGPAVSQLFLESYIENFRTYICVANNSIGTSIQCERDVTGHVISWWKSLENENYKIFIAVIAVIGGAILMVVIVCITIIVVCRRKRADDKCPSQSATKDKSKQELATSPSDGLLQPDGDKAFYENLPFHGMQSAPNKPFRPEFSDLDYADVDYRSYGPINYKKASIEAANQRKAKSDSPSKPVYPQNNQYHDLL